VDASHHSVGGCLPDQHQHANSEGDTHGKTRLLELRRMFMGGELSDWFFLRMSFVAQRFRRNLSLAPSWLALCAN
jgi:hypothetical protein